MTLEAQIRRLDQQVRSILPRAQLFSDQHYAKVYEALAEFRTAAAAESASLIGPKDEYTAEEYQLLNRGHWFCRVELSYRYRWLVDPRTRATDRREWQDLQALYTLDRFGVEEQPPAAAHRNGDMLGRAQPVDAARAAASLSGATTKSTAHAQTSESLTLAMTRRLDRATSLLLRWEAEKLLRRASRLKGRAFLRGMGLPVDEFLPRYDWRLAIAKQ